MRVRKHIGVGANTESESHHPHVDHIWPCKDSTSRGRSTTFGFQVRTAYDPVERRTDSEASLYIDARNTARKFDAQDWEATWYRRQRDPRLPIRSREVVEHKSRVPTGRMVGIELVVQALQILQTYHTRAAIYSNERDVQTERSEIEWSSTSTTTTGLRV